MPRAAGAMEKRPSYSEEKSWKTGGSDFMAADKQQTHGTPARPPNIAPRLARRIPGIAQRGRPIRDLREHGSGRRR